MAEKIIDYQVEEEWIRERGATTEVAVYGPTRKIGTLEVGTDSSQAYRYYVLYNGVIEAATVRRTGVRVGPIDFGAFLSGGSITLQPETYTTPAVSLPYPAGTRAEIIRPSTEQAVQGVKPLLRLRVPLKPSASKGK